MQVPRFEAATACTSSTITVSTPSSVSRAAEVSVRYSDSGVVMRMSGEFARARDGLQPSCRPDRAHQPSPRARALRGVWRSGSRPRAGTGGCARRRRRGLSAGRCRARGCGASGSRWWRCDQLVDRPEERGEGLARSGRRYDQRVRAARDRIPRAQLRRGGRAGKAPSNHSRVAGEKRSSTIAPSSPAPPTPCPVRSRQQHPRHVIREPCLVLVPAPAAVVHQPLGRPRVRSPATRSRRPARR